ncbi:hypothetical protein FAZ78_22865 [Cereibacter changlensis]|uniref:Uncharacterized protein n=1 Tax=Cereibacter changlensis TaxID=402884 RepID=A0A4U0YWD5_9RHOB|nr:hypothetical protein [Cereibacter changlensis]TKA94344.1 hypothetical protein FAZ78_22865 [Cereibacter changlensis]
MRQVYMRFYAAGHSRRVMPRRLRRLLARTGLHRAWLSGYLGCFWEDGIKYGPANPHAQRWGTPADEQEAEPAIPDLAFFADLWPRYPVSLDNADLTAAELPAAGRDDARDQPVSPASATCRPPQAGAALPSGTVS